MKLAPIGIITYSRINHLKKTINSLKSNELAKESELYIFSDAAKKGDEKIVKEIRKYIHSINGFKKVHIIERYINDRFKNALLGMESLFEKYDRYIFMEDDNIVSPSFLKFMNEALEYYKDDNNVFAVGGHTPNLKANKESASDVYFSKRFHPWGYALWRDKDIGHQYLPSVDKIAKDKELILNLDKWGNDLIDMVKLDAKGIIDTGDLKYCYYMNKNDKYMVLPTATLVRNIGLDGSGQHCGNKDPYVNDILSEKKVFKFEKVYHNAITQKEYKNFYDKPSLFNRIKNKLMKRNKN